MIHKTETKTDLTIYMNGKPLFKKWKSNQPSLVFGNPNTWLPTKGFRR